VSAPTERARPPVELREDRIDSAVGAGLIAALMDDLAARYGGPDPHVPDATEFHPPQGVFLVAWADDEPVACGGVRAHVDDGVGELKRMYTRPTVRRRGISRMLLRELEARARGFGYRRLVLETGTKQPEAMAMYESLGYERITPYGQYKDFPESRCYGKDL
jgi:GNAT superfamily N-acetyltransferase